MQPSSEIIVIGSGPIGLAIAIELRLLGAEVIVLTKDFKAAAGHAAAGMLAPQAERIANSAMLDLCLASRTLYPEWIEKIESIASVNAGYWPCGILSPYYTNPSNQAEMPASSAAEMWLDDRAIRQYQPQLGESVVGGYWYPQDGQVDNRALMQCLWQASQNLGVKFKDGVEIEAIHTRLNRVVHLETNYGEICAERYILATGAWSQQLLPIQIVPRKGQMLSVLIPESQRAELPLPHVLFGEEIYIVPRRDGRIVVGATSEDVGFTANNTLQAIKQLTGAAMRLFPPIQNYPLQETWWGFRPATPDELPILGESPYPNLTLATGHYRNGILLTPMTARAIADLVYDDRANDLLTAFSYQRFVGG